MTKKIEIITVLFISVWLTQFFVPASWSDTGYLNATRTEVGNTLQTRTISISDGSTVTIAAASNARPDLTCFNNSAFVVRVGSAQSVASLKVMGFPILSSASVRFGSLSGAVSAVIDTPASTSTFICADGLTQ